MQFRKKRRKSETFYLVSQAFFRSGKLTYFHHNYGNIPYLVSLFDSVWTLKKTVSFFHAVFETTFFPLK